MNFGTIDASPGKRQKAAEVILKVLELFSPVEPTTYTLHLEMPKPPAKGTGLLEPGNNWIENTKKGLELLCPELDHPEKISIETLDYPFDPVGEIAIENGFSVCIDGGHQFKYGFDLIQTFEKYRKKTPLLHVHGVDFSSPTRQDHTALDKLPDACMGQLKAVLDQFSGVVSLEVFNLENLNRSLNCLSMMYKNVPASVKP